jgi:hypothetical protein
MDVNVIVRPARRLRIALFDLGLVLGASLHAATITTYAVGGTNGNFSPTIGFPATNVSFFWSGDWTSRPPNPRGFIGSRSSDFLQPISWLLEPR